MTNLIQRSENDERSVLRPKAFDGRRDGGFWDIAPWGKRHKRQILYVINCECGEMSAWQLDADEPSPRDEVCEVCGRVLFEADGNAMQPLEKEFI